MLLKEAVKRLTKEQGVTQEELALKAGFKGQGGLASTLLAKNPGVETVLRILNALGYTLAIVKMDEVNMSVLEVPEGARKKTPSEE